MKKFSTLLLAMTMVASSMSQATIATIAPEETETAATAEMTTEQATSETDSSATSTDTADAPDPISPQVAKLIALYPRLVARIEPYGKVCFDGEECDITISVLSASADGGPRDGASIYKAVCHTCHETGLVGAPKFGNAGDWGPRIAKGKDTLYHNAINGIGAMPAKGGADILDEEVQNAVDYMIENSS